jgi:hypothetical protein
MEFLRDAPGANASPTSPTRSRNSLTRGWTRVGSYNGVSTCGGGAVTEPAGATLPR